MLPGRRDGQGRLDVTTDPVGATSTFMGSIALNGTGQVHITNVVSTNFANGMMVSPTGQLVFSTDPIVGYKDGYPIDALSRLVGQTDTVPDPKDPFVGGIRVGSAGVYTTLVAPPSGPVTVPGAVNLNWPVGVGVNYDMAQWFTGGALPLIYNVQTGVLPAGTTLVWDTGLITGTPTAVSVSEPITIRVTDDNGQIADKVINIAVSAIIGQSLIQAIGSVGLTGGLKLCLDAGDDNSYNPAVQTAKWFDTSGAGYDFYRGAAPGGASQAPVFFGTAGGLSSAEYFRQITNGIFNYDSASELWMNALHQDGALWSLFMVAHVEPLTTIQTLFSTFGNVTSSGVRIRANMTTAALEVLVGNGSGSFALNVPMPTFSFPTSAWVAIQASIDENGGATASFMRLDDSTATVFNGGYTAPSAVAAQYPMMLMARDPPAFTDPLVDGGRMACCAVWQGVALSQAQMNSLFEAVKDRWGIL